MNISKSKSLKKTRRNTVPGTLKTILRERKKNIQVLILFYNLMIFKDKDLSDISEYLEAEWENMELEDQKKFLKDINVKSRTQW